MLPNVKISGGDEGTLVAINKFDNFVPKRLFYISDVPKLGIRGQHAHKQNKQILICVSGEILVTINDGLKIETHYLRPNDLVYIDNMRWGAQQYLTGKDILLVLCSLEYDEDDYIRDYKEFTEIVKVSK